MTTDSDIALRKPDCVVIDTNIWRSELLLKTPVGVSLVYTLGRQKGFLGLPEIVEMELTKQILEVGLEADEKTKNCARTISILTDMPSYSSSISQIKLEQIVKKQLADLTKIFVRVPFTFVHAKAALEMVNAKVPPNTKKNQQFKDSAIWQAVLDLSREYTVHFVTNDRGFFLDPENPSNGLASNLQEQCTAAHGNVTGYCDLGSCLKAISSDRPSFDHERLKSLIESFVIPKLQAEATRLRYYEIKELLRADITSFRTTDPNRIAMDYTITIDVDSSARQDHGEECRAVAYGSCYYDYTSDSISDGFIQEIRFLSRSTRHARSFEYDDPSIPFPRQVPWD